MEEDSSRGRVREIREEGRNVECRDPEVRTESNGHFGENLEGVTGFWSQELIYGLKEQIQKEHDE